MDNKTPQQRRAERQKYMRIQRWIRTADIALAIILSIISLCQSCSTKKAIAELAEQLREKKIAEATAALQSSMEQSGEEDTQTLTVSGVAVTLSFVGSCTLAADENASYDGSFTQYYDRYGASYFFQNVKSIFEGDDLTVASLESTLSESGARRDQDTAFRADPSYVEILTGSGIDAVTVANAHTHDYGDESYVDTLAMLDNAGVERFGYDYTALVSRTGTPVGADSAADGATAVTVGLAGVWQGAEDNYRTAALEDIAELREAGAQIIIVTVSWTSETEDQPDDSQISMAHQLIDAGADLVVGIQPGVLQGIECYQGKYILYSLGSFLGDSDDMDTIIFQQSFVVSDGVCQTYADYTVIPCTISSDTQTNTYCPTPASGEEAQRILDGIYAASDLLDGGIRPADE